MNGEHMERSMTVLPDGLENSLEGYSTADARTDEQLERKTLRPRRSQHHVNWRI